jgi:orotate phosphoribosyltransferase
MHLQRRERFSTRWPKRPMTADDLRRELDARGALLTGHFRLSSGRHSDRFIQKFRILEDPRIVEPIAAEIAARCLLYRPTVVASAAVGGIVLGYETARRLGTKAIFVEKEGGIAVLRRGFALTSEDRVLVVEDVVTTGGSLCEVIDVARSHGAQVVAAGVIIQRAPADFGVPTITLLEYPVASFDPSSCPQCATGEPLSEPGSRFILKS